MPRDSNGNTQPLGGTIVSTGDPILPSQHNPALVDLYEMMSQSLSRDGQGGMRANLNMNGYRIINVATSSASGDLATNGSVDTKVNGKMNGRAYPRRSDGGDINFNWTFGSGQPTHIIAHFGNNKSEVQLIAPNSLTVGNATNANYATSAGNANTVGGWSTSTIQSNINSAVNASFNQALKIGVDNQLIGTTTGGSGALPKMRFNAATPYTAIQFWDGSAQRGAIAVTPSGTQYNTSSDYRLKSNVEELDADKALGTVNRIRPVEYNWRDNPDDVKSIGFIAHELQALFPESVSGKKDELDSEGKPVYQGVDYGRITPLLVSAIKALTRRIEQLENKDR